MLDLEFFGFEIMITFDKKMIKIKALKNIMFEFISLWQIYFQERKVIKIKDLRNIIFEFISLWQIF